jgi:hypothetical protein
LAVSREKEGGGRKEEGGRREKRGGRRGEAQGTKFPFLVSDLGRNRQPGDKKRKQLHKREEGEERRGGEGRYRQEVRHLLQ